MVNLNFISVTVSIIFGALGLLFSAVRPGSRIRSYRNPFLKELIIKVKEKDNQNIPKSYNYERDVNKYLGYRNIKNIPYAVLYLISQILLLIFLPYYVILTYLIFFPSAIVYVQWRVLKKKPINIIEAALEIGPKLEPKQLRALNLYGFLVYSLTISLTVAIIVAIGGHYLSLVSLVQQEALVILFFEFPIAIALLFMSYLLKTDFPAVLDVIIEHFDVQVKVRSSNTVLGVSEISGKVLKIIPYLVLSSSMDSSEEFRTVFRWQDVGSISFSLNTKKS